MNTQTRIHTDDTLMETVSHGSREFPFRFYDEKMSMFDFKCIEWHWHNELEFVLAEDGCMDISINEDTFTLSAGQGLFINSRAMHRFITDEDCTLPNFLCSPTFIAPEDSLIYEKYVSPVLTCPLSYVVFSPAVSWQAECILVMEELINLQRSIGPDELKTHILLQKFWHIFFSNISDQFSAAEKSDTASVSRARLRLMIQFVQENYASTVTLDDIASAASVSKSTALSIFRNYLHTTPISYLISYRLQEAALLLSSTEKKVSTIAGETGFEGVDYFCRKFKRHYGCTPGEYRNNRQ